MLALFLHNQNMRELNPDELKKSNVIAVFDSFLTRTLGMKQNNLYSELIIVKTYYYAILKNIINNGFICNGEKYICLTASAGQIRTKKTVFIKEVLWNKYNNTLMCGLTLDKINSKGGVNVNKYLAYLALCNSATDEWKEFDIDKSIVVDDMETLVRGTVDFIDHKTFTIERKDMDVPITHTDGCAMVLPQLSKKNFMIRLPWVKGLLAVFPYDEFIKENNCNGIIKDIYGVDHDIIKENIQVIFTKSQFKMWKYYNSWGEYKANYKKYNCSAGICNVEEDEFENAKINYQMLQTLTDMTDEELKIICEESKNTINNLSTDRKTMLKVFKATPYNTHRNNFQNALMLYGELLQDKYSKETLRSIKDSLEKEAWAGKLDIKGCYTFLIPDLYAFCEWLFLDNKNPKGLLENGQVFCKLFGKSPKLDCLRSPHLFKEHAIKNNIINDINCKWFKTKALYTSCHDLISKILQFDNDGDRSLVCADETIIEVAERNMQNIVPLYYEMAKAEAQIIDNNTIYKGLNAAYSGGNIGEISNQISKIWNSGTPNEYIVKLLCMLNNFVID